MQGFKDTPSKHNGIKGWKSRGMEKWTREGYSRSNEGMARGHQGSPNAKRSELCELRL